MREMKMIYELCIVYVVRKNYTNRKCIYSLLSFGSYKNAKTIFPPRRIKSRGFAFHSFFFIGRLKKCRKTIVSDSIVMTSF